MNDLELLIYKELSTQQIPPKVDNLLKYLQQSKNLLAFSGGIDSTALLYLLLKFEIPFDIAIIDYNLREQSKQEVSHAKELAYAYSKTIYIKEFHTQDANKFNQKLGRDFRYEFFNNIIKKHSYNNLLLAHQLDDKLEWFLMQISKGAGIYESANINIHTSTSYGYIIRPLLKTPKAKLQQYLKDNNLKYFVDNSNYCDKYKRNYFRKHFNSFLFANKYHRGLNKSFEYFSRDFSSLINNAKAIFEYQCKDEALVIYKKFVSPEFNMRIIDKELKKRRIIISSKTKKEIIKQQNIVIRVTISVSIDDKYIWICPNTKDVCMDKKFKELCRLNNIPKNTRAFLYQHKLLANQVIQALKTQE